MLYLFYGEQQHNNENPHGAEGQKRHQPAGIKYKKVEESMQPN
jgi:hypothetical protein